MSHSVICRRITSRAFPKELCHQTSPCNGLQHAVCVPCELPAQQALTLHHDQQPRWQSAELKLPRQWRLVHGEWNDGFKSDTYRYCATECSMNSTQLVSCDGWNVGGVLDLHGLGIDHLPIAVLAGITTQPTAMYVVQR